MIDKVSPATCRVGEVSSRGSMVASYALFMLCTIYAVNFVDRTIINTLAYSIQQELKLSDTELGLSGAAFALFYGGLSIPFARATERRSRVGVISLSLVVWSAATTMCGLVGNFWQLLAARLGIGVGQAGYVPAAQSLICDLFPARRWATAISVFSLGVPIGTMLGAIVGGWVTHEFGWRQACFVVGLPGILLAVAARLTLIEPVRGGSDTGPSARSNQAPSLMEVLRAIWTSITARHVILGLALSSIASSSIMAFFIIFLLRGFNISIAEAGFAFGLISGIAGAVGVVLGGVVTDWGARRDARTYGWVPAIALFITTPLLIAALLQDDLRQMTLVIIVPAILYLFPVGPSFAIMHHLLEPRLRATATGVVLFISTLVGMGIGPPLVGLISDLLTQQGFAGDFAALCPAAGAASSALRQRCAAASFGGLRQALVVSASLYSWAAVHYLIASRTVKKELR